MKSRDKKFKGQVDAFRENCTIALTLIKVYIDNDELDRIFQIANTMKAPAARVGAHRLSGIFSEIETAMASPNPVELRKLTQTAEMEYQLAIEALKAQTES